VRLRLGDLTFDSGTRQLLRGRAEVHVSPKAFDLLKLLIEARPRALAKPQLQEQLWPDLFVSETNLASLIGEIRRALDDDARRPRFVRTVHRFGYAFCGEAAEESAGSSVDSTPVCWLLKDRRRLHLALGENVLGREPDGGISLDSHTVSRRHARILVSERGAILEDLESKNGTFLRNARVTTPTALANGDQIRLGSVVMHFRTASGSKTATWSEQRHVVTRPLSSSPKRRISR
jgi:DNA-binding winged helix-turn-helix (wHTH) protein